MAGYVGNILVVYDMREPSRPEEVSRWWLPGQHVAAGETPSWPGQKNRLHHATRCGDELLAAGWHAGTRVLDVSDQTNPPPIRPSVPHPALPGPAPPRTPS